MACVHTHIDEGEKVHAFLVLSAPGCFYLVIYSLMHENIIKCCKVILCKPPVKRREELGPASRASGLLK